MKPLIAQGLRKLDQTRMVLWMASTGARDILDLIFLFI